MNIRLITEVFVLRLQSSWCIFRSTSCYFKHDRKKKIKMTEIFVDSYRSIDRSQILKKMIQHETNNIHTLNPLHFGCAKCLPSGKLRILLLKFLV